MNKRIYFNNKFIEFNNEPLQTSQNQSIRFIPEFSEETLNKVVSELLSETTEPMSKTATGYRTATDNFERVFDYLKKNLYYIEAAGGFIRKQNEFLFIYRFERWDLPKGKLDKGETIEEAAVRECEEECAIKQLKIEKQLSSTFHIYKYKDKFALKQTYWFYMTTDYDKKLKPQTEESITDVQWFDASQIEKKVFENSYFTIKDVVTEGLRVAES
jgi:8-oxo-dGTP pyrophosphatase MutT (NUDIX family)